MAKQKKKLAKLQGRRNARHYPRSLPRDSCLDDWLERRLYFDVGDIDGEALGARCHMGDLEIECKDCKEIFVVRKSEQEHFQNSNTSHPEFCPICRRKRRAEEEREKKRAEDEARKCRQQKDACAYEALLKDYHVIPLEEVAPQSGEKTLYVIGNGFDLMHGVQSSYYDFGKTIGKRSWLRFYLECYLKVDDLWADFEGALAKINVEGMCSPYIVDMFLRDMEAYDEDASAADFFVAAEMAAQPIVSISTDLRKKFGKWVCGLTANTKDRPLANVITKGKVLTFNYTEFMEELYGVPASDICYIHGKRGKKKGAHGEALILGHIPGASDAEYEFEDNYGGINLSGNRAQMIYDAQQTALRHVAEADKELTKDCNKIIKNHKEFFEGLSEIHKIIIIGHSLSPVDWDYFREIIGQNHAREDISWCFGCHGKGDLERIQTFINHFKIERRQASVFRTDTISVELSAAESVKQPNLGLKEKMIGCSDDSKWSAISTGNKVIIKDNEHKRETFSRIFSVTMSGAVFVGDICVLVAKGVYKGIFFLRYITGKWKYIKELEAIPNQGLINRRLNRILLDEDQLVFVYNSRVRKYDIKTGNMIYNQPIRKAREQFHRGDDMTEKFRRYYKEGFH